MCGKEGALSAICDDVHVKRGRGDAVPVGADGRNA